MPMPPQPPVSRPAARAISPGDLRLLLALAVGLFVVVLIRTAWLSDDAFITLRTVTNFLNGRGLTWNAAERVQVYTHPLWLGLLCGTVARTGELYFTTLLLSAASTLLAVALLCVAARSMAAAIPATLVLSLSHAFVDYSTSGLENPLTHALLGAFFLLYLRAPTSRGLLLVLSLLASLLMLNRMDAGLLVLPALLATWAGLPDRRRGLLPVLVGFLPFLGWEVYSLVYYGFPFPNTYYAKLHTGITPAALVEQGLYYLLNSLDRDPVTLLFTAAGVLAPFWLGARRSVAVSVGVLLYLIYVVNIGGDFMSGRFLAAPLYAATLVLAAEAIQGGRAAVAASGLALIAALAGPALTLQSDEEWGREGKDGAAHKAGRVDDRGIADERGFYYQRTGLLRARRNSDMPLAASPEKWGAELRARAEQTGKLQVEVLGAVGVVGLHAGPRVHIVDHHGLSDPLLARLPVVAFDRDLYDWRDVVGLQNWRIGHFRRHLPDGYLDSLREGDNRVRDERLHTYFERLREITRGPVWSWTRLRRIFNFNVGKYDDLVDEDAYRFPGAKKVKQSALAAPKPARTPAGHATPVPVGGLMIELDRPHDETVLELSLDCNDEYQVMFLRGSSELAARTLTGIPSKGPGLILHRLPVPRPAFASRYDRLVIFPVRGDGVYAVGHLRFVP